MVLGEKYLEVELVHVTHQNTNHGNNDRIETKKPHFVDEIDYTGSKRVQGQ